MKLHLSKDCNNNFKYTLEHNFIEQIDYRSWISLVVSHLICRNKVYLPALLPGGTVEGEADETAVVELKIGRGVNCTV